ncbi:hypothetical protein KF707_15015 [Candidatus Obscuribacterales bacterium]|nr:hypothetical protein [Candidatus Obscuribacterales bacterium]
MSKSKRKFKRPQSPQSPSGQNLEASEESGTSGDGAATLSQTAGSAASVSSAKPSARTSNSSASAQSLVGSILGIKRDEMRVPVDVNIPHVYRRPLWKHIVRYPAAFFLILLNVAVVMSFVERFPQHRVMDPFRELFFFGMVGFIDVFMFLPVLLEVNKIETDTEGLKVGALLWRVKLTWDQIVAFDQPKYLKFAILKTKKGMYFLNKYDLKPFYEVAEIISAKMKPTIQDRQS